MFFFPFAYNFDCRKNSINPRAAPIFFSGDDGVVVGSLASLLLALRISAPRYSSLQVLVLYCSGVERRSIPKWVNSLELSLTKPSLDCVKKP
jgi:hypothetical protein